MRAQYRGIKYPFSNENTDGIYLDLNESYVDKVKSDVLHVLFTPKGQRLRMPDFGTDLIKVLFNPKDDLTFNDIRETIQSDVAKYVPNVNISNITINSDPQDDNHAIIVIDYVVSHDGIKEQTTVGVKI